MNKFAKSVKKALAVVAMAAAVVTVVPNVAGAAVTTTPNKEYLVNTVNEMEIDVVKDAETEKSNVSNGLYYTDLSTGEKILVDIEIDADCIQRAEYEDRISMGSTCKGARFVNWEVDADGDKNGDDRKWVENTSESPYCAIGVIEVIYEDESIENSYGTGFMVSGKTMLTAAHTIAEKEAKVKCINVYLGCNGKAEKPTGKVASFYVCANFDPRDEYDYADDYAILRFSSNISQTWFGLYVPSNSSHLLGKGKRVSGYPGDKGNMRTKYFTMWSAPGSVNTYDRFTLGHDIDTENGQSGAPIYQYNASRHQWQAIAINVAGRDMPSLGGREVINYGRRITSELYDWLLEKKFITE